MSEKPQKVAIIGTGMAGLITSYILRTDPRFDVEVFEKQAQLSLDSASLTVSSGPDNDQKQHRIDLPMRVFADGFYANLKRMYDFFGVQYASPRFIYTMSRISDPGSTEIHPHFIHSSNNHQLPPLRPKGCSWIEWLMRVVYLAVCYYYFVACCFFVAPRTTSDTGLSESFRDYAKRIHIPGHYIKNYFLPLMSCVTTCSHNQLLDFPAIDVIGYQTKTFRKPHYTVLGGVNKVQAKLSKGQKVRYSAAVTAVENVGSKVKVTWKDGSREEVKSLFFDHVVLAVTPDVLRAIFPPLRKILAAVPTTPVHSIVHRDFARLPACSQVISARLHADNDRSSTHPIHIISNASTTESTHQHPSSVLISTSPIVPIDSEKVISSTTFTRVLRTPTSRQVTLDIFESKPTGPDGDSKQWQNGDGNVWLVGGWCWDGMVMLEGCIASAIRVAEKLNIEVPWAS
ncbi:hypothetical protein N7468_003218 [Penicillium chermesinum]|uniref:Amine oxidase domain-containing protein n=1 Tax=Penicillium chermesinum TaxID=63820 RepID=A0A9W9TT59_9EURO|nr:uncharacterized protein N7468_003218 [Penicillium chermesinum]KAJ5238599.1 hypothetical protein N7468_003218 [Penicillium chermesinum]